MEKWSNWVAKKKLCGSPIEEKFAVAWLDLLEREYLDGGGGRFKHGLDVETFLQLPEQRKIDWLTVQQFDYMGFQCPIGSYKADFALGRMAYTVKFDDAGDGEECLIRLPMVVVECDGHDFHERTKEQAQHDKSRDRFMTAHDFRVLRFTGSEIHRNAAKCAQEVDALFECLLNPRIIDAARPNHGE